MYIWLKKDADLELERLKKQGLLGEIRVETHRNSGKKHIVLYEDPFDPTADLIEIPEGLVEKVTWKEKICCGFRTEGVYSHNGATLLVKGDERVHSEMMMQGPLRVERWQWINVSAPTIAALKEIYTLVREGLLGPDRAWGEFADAPTPAPVE